MLRSTISVRDEAIGPAQRIRQSDIVLCKHNLALLQRVLSAVLSMLSVEDAEEAGRFRST